MMNLPDNIKCPNCGLSPHTRLHKIFNLDINEGDRMNCPFCGVKVEVVPDGLKVVKLANKG